MWTNVEWLYWAASGQPVPVLATSSPVGTARSLAGVLGNPMTDVLYGGQRGNNDFRSGFRLIGGFWLNDSHTYGIEGDFFFLGGSRNGFAAGSSGAQIIGRPFFNVLTGGPDAALVSYPGTLGGTLTVDSQSNVIGGGVNAIHNLCCKPCSRVDLLYGYRYFNLTDDITIQEGLTTLGGTNTVPAGVRIQLVDHFRTVNNFNGGLIGLSTECRHSSLFFGLRASVTLGANQQITDINGSSITVLPGSTPQAFAGGLLAQPSNIGHYTRTVFAVMPEIGVRAGVQVTEHARVYLGYNFIYLSNVARAGDQIDLRVNPNFFPPRALPVAGPALPAYIPNSTDFWLQGVSVGLQFRF